MPLSAGDRLGPYEILAPIGAGGMGEVYRARDTRLNREIAIKLSKEQFSERFEREARAVAALNHPNICQLYDVGPNYLVMELIGGGTPKGPMPEGEVLRVAQQIANALDAAHEKGIVHRDLKPANIKITPDGVVKVLDFGLAKIGRTPSSVEDSPTFTMGATQAGMILGTAAYMAPEQARGKPVDKRADIWAFGVVVYELLTGEQLYKGETVSDTLAAVLREEPSWGNVPVRFRTLLRRCLEKDPRNRLRDVGDAIPMLTETPAEEARVETRPSPRWPWAAAIVFACAALALSAIHFREKPPALPAATRFQIRLPESVKFASVGSFTLSPDGRRLAFSAVDRSNVPRVWIQDMDALEARPLAATYTGPAVPPFFWSPDSRFVVYSENSPKLKKVDIQSGSVQEICDKPGPPVGGSWNKDGVIIFGSNNNSLWKVPATGGTPAPLTALDASKSESSHQLPSFLPDGRHFLYLRVSSNAEVSGIYSGSLDDPPERQSKQRILATSRGANFVPSETGGSGWLLFLRGNTLMAQSFEPAGLKLSGDEVAVAEGVGSVYQTGLFTAAGNGLVYESSAISREVQLTWFDRQGKRLGKVGEPGEISFVRMSPDGKHAVYEKQTADQNSSDIWLLDLKKDASTRFTFGSARAMHPIWSADGSEIVFSLKKDVFLDLYRKPSDGAREEELLLKSNEHKEPLSWSPDGRFLLYATSKQESTAEEDLWVLPMQGDRTPYPFLATRFDEREASFSPDGRWVAYISNESGPYQVYVREFKDSPKATGTGGKWMVSKDDGYFPQWKPDGREIVYISRFTTGTSSANGILSVPVETAHTFQAGAPHEFTQTPIFGMIAPAPDFQRFLVRVSVENNAPQAFTIVLNWTSVLKSR